MKRRKEVGRLDIENPKCKWHKTVYLKDGKLMKTIHDGTFSPFEPEHTPPSPPSYDPITFKAGANNSTLSMTSTLETAPTIYYSTDNGTNWQQWEYTTSNGTHTFSTITLANKDDEVLMYGDNAMMGDTTAQSTFVMSGSIAASGRASALTDNKLSKYNSLFKGCAALTVAPELPHVLSQSVAGCYRSMFENCTGLLEFPRLPSTVLVEYCYYRMFYGCTSIESASLKAENLPAYCYYEMFSGCESLATITCLGKTVTETSTTNWLSGVAASGTFTKNSEMSSWAEGASGIPQGWNVDDYEEVVVPAQQ